MVVKAELPQKGAKGSSLVPKKDAEGVSLVPQEEIDAVMRNGKLVPELLDPKIKPLEDAQTADVTIAHRTDLPLSIRKAAGQHVQESINSQLADVALKIQVDLEDSEDIKPS